MTFECEFCHRKFQRERTVAVHMCEPKRRRLSRGERGVELGFQAYIRFYEIAQGSAQTKTFDDFCESPYYRAFVKWGHYCVNARIINPKQFLEWLLRNNRKIDHWASDRMYDEFLLYYLQNENMTDAVSRAIEWSIGWGEQNSAPAQHCLRHGNHNAICHAIITGKLSAWVLYNSDSGREFLSSIGPEQTQMIWSYVDTDYWQRRFQRYGADTAYAQEILQKAGW
jgi:hypothetical protein